MCWGYTAPRGYRFLSIMTNAFSTVFLTSTQNLSITVYDRVLPTEIYANKNKNST